MAPRWVKTREHTPGLFAPTNDLDDWRLAIHRGEASPTPPQRLRWSMRNQCLSRQRTRHRPQGLGQTRDCNGAGPLGGTFSIFEKQPHAR
jgi:hypothetical protein